MISVEISITCEQWLAACPDAGSLAERAARAALAAELPARACGPVTLGIVLTDDCEQRALNLRYRAKDSSTNVLSFALVEVAQPHPAGAPVLLGDVVLAFETVAREAAEQDKNIRDHLAHLVVHGVLHLLGFDHESEAEAAIMEARETEMLATMGVPAPYADTM